jgi:molybdopterin synthase sulfur carrier subunit
MEAARHDEVHQSVQVRVWAAARAALGAPEVTLEVTGPVSVAWVREELVRRHPDRGRLPSVLGICSVLVGDQPLGKGDPATVVVQPGGSVEFLPPFAGG